MSLTREQKVQVVKAQSKLGLKPKEIADRFEINVQTVYSILQGMKGHVEDENITEAVQVIDADILHHVIEEAKEQATTQEVVAKLENIETGLDGLKKLDACYQATMQRALKRCDAVLDDENTPLKDIMMVMKVVADTHGTMFEQGTQIHIGDNNSQSNTQLSMFKNSMGA